MIKTVRDNSAIIQAFKDKNLSTGLYVVSFQLNNIEPIAYRDTWSLLEVVNLAEMQIKFGASVNFYARVSAFKSKLFADMNGKINNTPYLIYFVNEEGIDSFGFFFNVECDDKLRFCKDWRKYVKG